MFDESPTPKMRLAELTKPFKVLKRLSFRRSSRDGYFGQEKPTRRTPQDTSSDPFISTLPYQDQNPRASIAETYQSGALEKLANAAWEKAASEDTEGKILVEAHTELAQCADGSCVGHIAGFPSQEYLDESHKVVRNAGVWWTGDSDVGPVEDQIAPAGTAELTTDQPKLQSSFAREEEMNTTARLEREREDRLDRSSRIPLPPPPTFCSTVEYHSEDPATSARLAEEEAARKLLEEARIAALRSEIEMLQCELDYVKNRAERVQLTGAVARHTSLRYKPIIEVPEEVEGTTAAEEVIYEWDEYKVSHAEGDSDLTDGYVMVNSFLQSGARQGAGARPLSAELNARWISFVVYKQRLMSRLHRANSENRKSRIGRHAGH
ncbi:hypothetical protein BOTBODRAFT_526038 [Botryobasidium botryosum FD-172 SS1]|uniref:Uncharacterized protein n=1 Tax=Botryobasidium botryosum (strain FD-172 SS1) TaxID=930990 RepID=A0A067MCG8_BOTB1|nr:hypothetical protein BOTBODRAFT_526038 [Botryobasidium botryosum FD-172 SS1]